MPVGIPNTLSRTRARIPAIIIEGYNLGGIGDSIYSGTKGALAQIVGFDLHAKPGTMQVNQRLAPMLSGPLGYGQIINPSNEAKLFVTNSDIYADVKGTGGDNEAQAMSFKALYPIIYSVDLRVTLSAGVGDQLRVEIVSSLTGNSLGTAVASPTTNSQSYVNFKFATGIPVSIGQTYYVRITRTIGRNTTSFYRLNRGTPNLYPGGSLWTQTNGNWFQVPTQFIDFTINATSGLRADLYKFLECSDGNVYLFGKYKGDVVKLTSNGTFTLMGNIDSGTNPFKICDAAEYNSYIYISTPDTLFQWDFTKALSSAINFGSFITNTVNHQMLVHGQVLTLYIADGSSVAQVYAPVGQAATFSTKAISINAPFTVTALGQQGTNLLIGASILKNVSNPVIYPNIIKNRCRFFIWDTYSISFSYSTDVAEPCFNCFMTDLSTIFFSAGFSGNIYYFDGVLGQIVKTIQGVYSPTSYNYLLPLSVSSKNGIALFALSNNQINDVNLNLVSGTGLAGLYTFGARNSSYPTILTLEYPVSTGNLSNLLIYAVTNILNNYYVSYFDQNTGQILIDQLDWNNKYKTPYFDTLVSDYSKEFIDRYKKFVISFESLPSGTSIDFLVNVDNLGFIDFNTYNPNPVVIDVQRSFVQAVTDIMANTFQLRVMPSVSGNLAPVIQNGIILME